VVIDDTAGRDTRLSELSSLPDVKIICPPFNLGHQRAIVFGLRLLAKSLHDDDVVVTLDADGEDRPQDFSLLLQALLSSTPRDAVALARRTRRETSVTFKALYSCFQLLFLILTGMVVKTGNFACLRGAALKRVIHHPYFDYCYSSAWLALPLERTLVPCARGKRFAGKSRMNLLSLVSHGLSMLLPFMERIAIRVLFLSAALFFLCLLSGALILMCATCSLGIGGSGVLSFLVQICGLALILLAIIICCLSLFVHVSQSKAIFLRDLEERHGRSALPS
jgi:hypothetical protein